MPRARELQHASATHRWRCVLPAAAILGLALMFAGVAEARMYQWNNPQTGHVQLSGTPPTWYRGSVGGPRVLVYENGALVDDTSLKVSEERAFDLREAAFDEAERRKERVVLKRLEEVARREAEKAERTLRRQNKREARLVPGQASPNVPDEPESRQ